MRRLGTTLVVAVLAVAAAAGCGRRETPEQRLARLRAAHEIVPVGFTTVTDAEGSPALVVDLRVVNHAAEPLPHLTVAVRVVGADGAVRVERRATLDLTRARPGVGVQLAARLPGVAVEEGEQVQVELENDLPPEVLRTLPEWADVTGGG